METKYTKENHYTISVSTEEALQEKPLSNAKAIFFRKTLKKTFNFYSGEVATESTHCIFQVKGDEAGSSSSVSVALDIRAFNDIPFKREIILMHGKLREMGGNPPSLEELRLETKPAAPVTLTSR